MAGGMPRPLSPREFADVPVSQQVPSVYKTLATSLPQTFSNIQGRIEQGKEQERADVLWKRKEDEYNRLMDQLQRDKDAGIKIDAAIQDESNPQMKEIRETNVFKAAYPGWGAMDPIQKTQTIAYAIQEAENKKAQESKTKGEETYSRLVGLGASPTEARRAFPTEGSEPGEFPEETAKSYSLEYGKEETAKINMYKARVNRETQALKGRLAEKALNLKNAESTIDKLKMIHDMEYDITSVQEELRPKGDELYLIDESERKGIDEAVKAFIAEMQKNVDEAKKEIPGAKHLKKTYTLPKSEYSNEKELEKDVSESIAPKGYVFSVTINGKKAKVTK